MRARGLTLLELLIAIALGVILLTVGIPSLTALLSNNTLSEQTKIVRKHLSYARNEAINSQTLLTVCLVGSPQNGDEHCLAADQEGAVRLLIFIDSNNDNRFNAGETLIAASSPFAQALTITSSEQGVLFNSDGTLVSLMQATLSLCIAGENQTDIIIAPSGSTQVQHGDLCP